MYPVLFELCGIKIYSYGAMFALSAAAVFLLVYLRSRAENLDYKSILDVAIYVIVFAVIGGRLLYIAQNFTYYRYDLFEIIMVNHGGLSFFGGLFAGIITVVVFVKKRKLDIFKIGDIFCLYMPIGHAIGRMGCFLNGCCYGTLTSTCLGVTFPVGSYPALSFGIRHKIHPVQIYSIFFNIILFLLLAYRYKRKHVQGSIAGLYFILYGIERFIIEYFRADHHYILGILTVYQVFSIISVTFGFVWILFAYRRSKTAG